MGKKRKQKPQNAGRKRTAKQQDGDKTRVFQQRTSNGYNVEMIRDFLDHLLLEVQAQHYENLKAVKKLDATGDMTAAVTAAGDLAPSLVERFRILQKKYATALIFADVVDGNCASDIDVRDYTTAFLRHSIERRDAQIGHLEALQELFDEALACAKLPFGATAKGNFIQAQSVHSVRQFIDELSAKKVPPYGLLKPQFDGHFLATEAGLEELKQAKVIVATSDSVERPFVLFGQEEYRRAKAAGESSVPALCLRVGSPDELQFALSAIIEVHGRIDYHGQP